MTIDAPAVKGNPKGLMRAGTNVNNSDGPIWFYTTTVGKHTYATVLLAPASHERVESTFDKEGAYAKWKKEKSKRYFVFRYKLDGDTLMIDCGDYGKFQQIMKKAEINGDGTKHLEYYFTPAGWLEKYLTKNDADKLFDGTNYLKLTRKK